MDKYKILFDLVVKNVNNIYEQLGTSLTECMYTKALELSLKADGCACRVEDPIPVQFNIGEDTHTIGYCRIDINAQLPNDKGGIRFILELKHSHINPSIIKQATQQVIGYTNLMKNSDTHPPAQCAFVIVFPKSNQESPHISMIDCHGK